MNELLFFERREQDWKRLSYLCDRADASPANLRSAELREFVKLYRRVSSDLSLARTKSSNLQLIAFLNDLCARAYSQIYRPSRKGFWKSLAVLPGLSARTVRRRWRAVAASAALFLGSAAFAYFALRSVPDTRNYFIPKEAESSFSAWKRGQLPNADAGRSMAGTLMYQGRNPLAALMTGASAAGSFGILTAQILFFNGAMLGALYSETSEVGRAGFVTVHILPHGVTELSGLVISGAAGFALGAALIFPGRRKRGDALREAGKDGLVLLGTSIVLMFIAAPIEGFFSFNPNVPSALRISFIAVSAAAWATFWLGYGRRDDAGDAGRDRVALPTALK